MFQVSCIACLSSRKAIRYVLLGAIVYTALRLDPSLTLKQALRQINTHEQSLQQSSRPHHASLDFSEAVHQHQMQQEKHVINWTDPTHSSRLRRFSHHIDNFPLPQFHGCDKSSGLCHFSNVCFSGNNGMMIFDVPGLKNQSQINNNNNNSLPISESFGRIVTEPRRIKMIPQDEYKKMENIYFADSLFVCNCWKVKQNNFNPAHLMMGMGKLFVYALGFYTPEKKAPPPVDMVLYHHCTTTDAWPWGYMMDRAMFNYAVAAGVINKSHNNDGNDLFQEARMFLPYLVENVVVCGATVYQEPYSVAKYLGNNAHSVVKQWQGLVADFVKKQHLDNGTKEIHDDDDNSQHHLSSSLCSRNLKVATWKRTDGSALRLLTNEEDIRQLVREFSNVPLATVSASSDTPPLDQIALFRSFDILITPHGSHLANMLFAHDHAVFIEVAAVPFDFAPSTNGAAFAKDWILSFGHLPVRKQNGPDLLLNMSICSEKSNPECPKSQRLKYIQSDLLVNITILRADLERATTALCSK
jgi:Glycosyltransferase 61